MVLYFATSAIAVTLGFLFERQLLVLDSQVDGRTNHESEVI